MSNIWHRSCCPQPLRPRDVIVPLPQIERAITPVWGTRAAIPRPVVMLIERTLGPRLRVPAWMPGR